MLLPDDVRQLTLGLGLSRCQKAAWNGHKKICAPPVNDVTAPPVNDVTAILSNAQEMGRLHPDTFTAQPSPEQLDGLKAGDVVKICVPDPGERFWCIIKAVNGHTITAQVDNELAQVPWPVGMKLRFHRDCVYAVDSGVKTATPFSRQHHFQGWIENQRLVHGSGNR